MYVIMPECCVCVFNWVGGNTYHPMRYGGRWWCSYCRASTCVWKVKRKRLFDKTNFMVKIRALNFTLLFLFLSLYECEWLPFSFRFSEERRRRQNMERRKIANKRNAGCWLPTAYTKWNRQNILLLHQSFSDEFWALLVPTGWHQTHFQIVRFTYWNWIHEACTCNTHTHARTCQNEPQ